MANSTNWQKRLSVRLGVSIITLFAYLVANFYGRELVGALVHFIGNNFTGSKSLDLCSYRCTVIWDDNLKIAMYLFYTIAYILTVYGLVKLQIRHAKSVPIQRVLIALFIVSSPVPTHWSVEYVCGGFMGHCVRHIDVVAPIIVAHNPISIIVGGSLYFLLAYGFVQRASKRVAGV